MGFKSFLKKSVKTVAKTAVKQVTSPDGILTAACPQLGAANALVKGVTGGQIDPLKMATSYGKNLIAGQFENGEIKNAAGEVVDMVSGSVKLGVGSYESLKESLKGENLSKLEQLGHKSDAIIASRELEREHNSNKEQAAAVDALDLSQPNQFSKVFYSVAKNLPTSYTFGKPTVSLALGSQTYAAMTATTAWSVQTVDDHHEWLTDLVKVPLMSTPVSSVSTLITLINSILDKLDDDGAMIEFLAIFNYPGPEVVLPNIEGRNPLANACLSRITKELIYKHMNQWISATYRNGDELDFYREIMSEWLGDEISISHPMYVDMISSAVVSLKGHTIARYLLENSCPYLANSGNATMIARYHETKNNPYDLLQYCRNIQLNAQISYATAIKPAYTAALGAVAMYHEYAYLVLTLCVKLLNDSVLFMKSCMTDAQVVAINAKLIIDPESQYLFDLANNDSAWINAIDNESLATAVTQAQLEYSGITVGDHEISIEEVESGIDAAVIAVNSATDPDFGVMASYRNRTREFKDELLDMLTSGDIDQTKYQTVVAKIDNLVATINAKMGA